MGHEQARLFFKGKQLWIENLGRVNATHIAYYNHQGQLQYKSLKNSRPWALANNDQIVLCYAPQLGPYITLKFKNQVE